MRIKNEEYIGKKYGKLTIIGVLKEDKKWYFECRCDCGTIKKINKYCVLQGNTQSCGCYQKSVTKNVGLNNRKYAEKCTYCGKEEHYAKGLCKNCYCRAWQNGTPKYRKERDKKNEI